MEFNLFMNIMSQLEDRYLKNREALDASVLRKNVSGRLRKFNLINSALHYEKGSGSSEYRVLASKNRVMEVTVLP